VKLHRNAKTTPVTRALRVERVRVAGWHVAAAATAQSISRRTAYKWLRRHRRGQSLEDAPAVPHRQPRRTPAPVVAAILSLRQQRWTAWQIAVRLQVPRSTVARVLVRAGLNRLALLQPREPIVRYERRRPGELLHVDIKRLGRIRGVGHRIHGNRRISTRTAGWEAVHVCVDDCSRAAYVEVRRNQSAREAVGFLRRAITWFAQRGVPVERVMTDNGAASTAERFHAACRRHRVRHVRTRPYRPQTNGKAERFIQTLLREWAYARPSPSSAQRTGALGPWLTYYNRARPHAALGYRSPASRFPRVAQ
jgi:transposase InsO family protein